MPMLTGHPPALPRPARVTPESKTGTLGGSGSREVKSSSDVEGAAPRRDITDAEPPEVAGFLFAPGSSAAWGVSGVIASTLPPSLSMTKGRTIFPSCHNTGRGRPRNCFLALR